jgi:hypothetical protein
MLRGKKMNPNLRKLAKETKNPEVSLDDKVQIPLGCIYVPDLNLAVRKIIDLTGRTYKEIKEIQQQRNAKILTPPQWWFLWDNYPELFEGNYGWEFVDAFAYDRKDLVVGSKLIDDNFVDGKRYENVLINLSENLRLDFSRKDIDEETGLPTLFEKGLHKFDAPKEAFAPMLFGGRPSSDEAAHVILGFTDSYANKSHVGVRLCYEVKR